MAASNWCYDVAMTETWNTAQRRGLLDAGVLVSQFFAVSATFEEFFGKAQFNTYIL